MLNFAMWIYSDRDVVMKASFSENGYGGLWEQIVNLHLRKGWNIVYSSDVYTDMGYRTSLTTQKPDGANLRWMFGVCCCDIIWGSLFSRSATTRVAENRRSFFRR